MNDRIELRAIRALGHHGALEGEQDRAQPFEIDLDIETSFDAARNSDDLADAIDYGAVVATVVRVVSTTRFHLIEALSGAVADAVLADGRVDAVTVTLRKVRPPVPADLASVGVRTTRDRSTDPVVRP